MDVSCVIAVLPPQVSGQAQEGLALGRLLQHRVVDVTCSAVQYKRVHTCEDQLWGGWVISSVLQVAAPMRPALAHEADGKPATPACEGQPTHPHAHVRTRVHACTRTPVSPPCHPPFSSWV